MTARSPAAAPDRGRIRRTDTPEYTLDAAAGARPAADRSCRTRCRRSPARSTATSGCGRSTTTSRASTRASRSASGSSSPAACSTATAGRCRNTLVEIWQCNAAGRYIHQRRPAPAPLDPNFTGAGRCLTDDDGRYRFITIKPGAYPWGNHENAWRPAHIHFSLFGPAFATRLVTQMYFPGDPLFEYDPIFNSVRDPAGARADDRALRPDDAPSPSGRSGTSGTSCCAAREATPTED